MMLELNEKKIRKGKPIGLPYRGSKKKISKKIVEIIKQNFGTEKPVYDIFGGGGAITAECLLNGLEVHYNDLDRTITDMFQRVLATDREFLKTLIISRDEFLKIREKENKTVDDELKLLVNSFGNNRKGYLYSEEFSDLKYNLAIEIIKNHDTFDGYKKTETYLEAKDIFKDQTYQKPRQDRKVQLAQLQQLQQLEQLRRLQQLERLQQLSRIEVTNLDYTAFSGVEDTILYLDPPYQGAIGYEYGGKARSVLPDVYNKIRQKLLKMPTGSVIVEDEIEYKVGTYPNNDRRMYVKDLRIQTNRFDSQSFYDWTYEMSKKNIVLISSYEISDSRFECVYEFKTARSTVQGGTNNSKTEKLFMVKKGEE